MTRRRLYNPAQLTRGELKASFVARQNTLARMLSLIGEQPPGHPCQHMMIVGPRGMGKTTLGLRFLHEIEDTPELAVQWQPVAFHEENYEIGDLADFWLAALRHLAGATGDPRWADRAEALARDETDTYRCEGYALSALMDYCQESGKRLVLFVENIDIVFSQFRDEREAHALRAALIERSELLLLGSANTVFQAIRSRGEAFYEFFRLFILEGLGPEETRRVFAALSEREDPDRDPGRLETMRRLTGGNPRLLGLACRMLIESPLGSAFEDLERLIDEQTPYFKARIEELPVQARKVFHCLAEGWRPMLAREVSGAAKLSSSHASAQLKQLVNRGYARELRLSNEKRARYEVGDRFYNIYYLLRFSRGNRERLERLVAFLHDLFGPAAMRTMYPAALETLRAGGRPAGEASDLLAVLARRVAGDEGFEGREDWLREAVALAGPDEPATGEIGGIVEGRLAEAQGEVRIAFEKSPRDAAGWRSQGEALEKRGHYEEAVAAFERSAECAGPNDPPGVRHEAASALLAQGRVLCRLDRDDEAVASLGRVARYVHGSDPVEMRHTVVHALACEVILLRELERFDALTGIAPRAPDHVHPDDPPSLRHYASNLLAAVGSFLLLYDKKLREAEAALRTAVDLDSRNGQAWGLLARAIVHRDDDACLPEVAACIRRAVEAGLEDPAILFSSLILLANRGLLANSGAWAEALGWFEHALRAGGDDFRENARSDATDFLVRAAAAGHARRVRQVMENANLTEQLEPLWHAVRAELGEDLEPLPAEIMAAVADVRERFAAAGA